MTVTESAGAPRRNPPAVYFSAAAQDDNLGDAVIRRTVLGWLPDEHRSMNVFVGDMSDGYVTAVTGRRAGLRLFRSAADFTRSWAGSVTGGRAALVFAPGPRTATRSLFDTRSGARALLLTGATRLSRGAVVAVGGALSASASPGLLAHRLTARLTDHYSVRDPASQRLLPSSTLIPDVAFFGAEPSAVVPAEPVLAISLRSDRPLALPGLAELVRLARRGGLEPVLVTQVRRDEQLHDSLSAEFGVRHLGWQNHSHDDQLRRIDELYSRAAAVYSNRLHACILAARHGAVPLNAEDRPDGKIATTLGGVFGHDAVRPTGADGEDSWPIGDLDLRRPAAARAAARAAADLVHERARVRALVTRPAER